MFQWDESINGIGVSADKVVHLFRSMREVQLALPGVPAQQASAYLCQYKHPDGIATVAVFHLQKSGVLAFYFSDPRIVPEQKMDGMLDQGLNFVESMGFLLTDQDIHLLDEADQQMLWESLPLKAGLSTEEPVLEPAQTKPPETKTEKPPAAVATRGTSPEVKKPATETVAKSTPAAEPSPVVEPAGEAAAGEGTEDETSENVDDLLAAVEAMRAKRPGLRARKAAPSAEEMNRRKEQLRETVGRILASL